jgi:hypothetical protein
MLADGSILLKPQKPELRVPAKKAAKMTGKNGDRVVWPLS